MSSPAATSDPYHEGGILHAIQSLLFIIVVAIFIVAFTVQPFQIPSGSMEPSLLVGDFLLVNKQVDERTNAATSHDPVPDPIIHRGDIVVFHYPVDPSMHLVKRVIGLPGDHIRMHGNHVFLSGRQLDEPYAVYRSVPPDGFRDNFPRMSSAEPGINARWWIQMRGLIDHGELLVPPDSYFVLGDNRNDSEDSRYWGFVPRSAIVGRPLVIYFSVRQAERSDSPEAPQSQGPMQASRIEQNIIDRLVDFARWDRILRIVR